MVYTAVYANSPAVKQLVYRSMGASTSILENLIRNRKAQNTDKSNIPQKCYDPPQATTQPLGFPGAPSKSTCPLNACFFRWLGLTDSSASNLFCLNNIPKDVRRVAEL